MEMVMQITAAQRASRRLSPIVHLETSNEMCRHHLCKKQLTSFDLTPAHLSTSLSHHRSRETFTTERSSNTPHLVTYPLNFTECYYLSSECPIPTLFIYPLFLMFQSSPQHLISLKFSDLPAVHILP